MGVIRIYLSQIAAINVYLVTSRWVPLLPRDSRGGVMSGRGPEHGGTTEGVHKRVQHAAVQGAGAGADGRSMLRFLPRFT